MNDKIMSQIQSEKKKESDKAHSESLDYEVKKMADGKIIAFDEPQGTQKADPLR